MYPFHPSESISADTKTTSGTRTISVGEPLSSVLCETRISELGVEDKYCESIYPVLKTLAACIRHGLHEVSPVATAIVFHLLSNKLLPGHEDGLCGFASASVRDLNPFDFLLWMYNIGAIGEKWWEIHDIEKAKMATPIDSVNPETRFTLTKPWIKTFVAEGNKPIGVVKCEWCYGNHFKWKCTMLQTRPAYVLPHPSMQEWEDLFKSLKYVLTPPKPLRAFENKGAFSHIVSPSKTAQKRKLAPKVGSHRKK